MKKLIEIQNLKKYYSHKKTILKVVNDISFSIEEGKTLGLVGESGCGKSTLAKALLRILPAYSGKVFFEGKNILSLSKKKFFPYRRKMQMVFQDPYSSLNPCMTIGQILTEPFVIHPIIEKNAIQQKIIRLLDLVRLPSSILNSYPSEFSGGQRQRIVIARAISLRPQLLVCDEPVAALDVSVQAQILNLLFQLQQEFKLSYLMIAHDLSVVRYLSQNIAIMYFGEIVEMAPTKNLFSSPKHPYTQLLIHSISKTSMEKKEKSIREIPSFLNPPKGCSFCNRCPFAKKICFEKKPPLKEVEKNHLAACWLNESSLGS